MRLVNILDWPNGFEDTRVVDQNVCMTVLLLDLFEKCCYRSRIGDVSGHRERLNRGVRLCNRASDFFKFVGSARNEDNCFCACGGERGYKCLIKIQHMTLMIDGDTSILGHLDLDWRQ